MNTLFDRLIEICREQGIEKPKGKDIQQLIGRSSGRVTQIKQGGEAARLGEDSLAKIIKLGYAPDWVQFNRGARRIKDHQFAANHTLTHVTEMSTDQLIEALAASLKSESPAKAKFALAQLEYAISKDTESPPEHRPQTKNKKQA
jgi:hypothetical protein